MSKKLIIVFVAVILMALGGLGYLVYQSMPKSEAQNNQNKQDNSNTPTDSNPINTSPTSTEENNATSSEPYIRVIFPNGQNSWKIGEAYEVSWQTSKVKSVDIILENWDKMDGAWPSSILIARNISASLGRYSFVLAEDKLPKVPEKIGDHFKIRIVSYPLDYTISDRSDNFFSVQ